MDAWMPFLRHSIMMMITRDRPIMMPGIQPPMNISPTETPVMEAYTTNAMEGGMTMAMEEALAIREEAKGAEKPPRLIMAGIRIMPRAATVAGPEPEMAPKKQATITATMAMPPRRWPTQSSANATRRLEMPALAMMLPDRTKNGIASSRNFAMPLYTLVGTTVRGELLKSRAKMEDMPRLTAMGIFSSSITKKLPNRIKLIIQSLCLPLSQPASHRRPCCSSRRPDTRSHGAPGRWSRWAAGW